MDQKMIARQLLRLAREVLSFEFPTKEALDKYLSDHPGADRSNHSVAPKDKRERSPDAPEEKSQMSGGHSGFPDTVVFDMHEKAVNRLRAKHDKMQAYISVKDFKEPLKSLIKGKEGSSKFVESYLKALWDANDDEAFDDESTRNLVTAYNDLREEHGVKHLPELR
jgi:hypothetical protein